MDPPKTTIGPASRNNDDTTFFTHSIMNLFDELLLMDGDARDERDERDERDDRPGCNNNHVEGVSSAPVAAPDSNNNNNNGDKGWILIESSTDSETEPADSLYLVSIDPGSVHCAAVRYNATLDRITHAKLYNLVCTCPPSLQNRGPVEQALVAREERDRYQKLLCKDIPIPTTHDFPTQLLTMIQQDGLSGPFQYEPEQACGQDKNRNVRVIVERQNARDSGNVAVQSALLARYHEIVQLQDPNEVKHFWNQATRAIELPCAFREKGSHAVNKTDAKNMIPRILNLSEQSLIRIAAEQHASHKAVCRSYLERLKKQKRRGRGRRRPQNSTNNNGGTGSSSSRKKRTVIHTQIHDLMDAALQAICVAQLSSGRPASDPHGVAVKRLKRGKLRLELEQESKLQWDRIEEETGTRKRKRKREPKQRLRTSSARKGRRRRRNKKQRI